MKIILLTLLLIVCAYSPAIGQYDAEVSSYTIFWNKLDAGQSPVITDTFKSDTSVTMLWERGDGTEAPYVSPYTGTIAIATVIVNTPVLWTDDTAAIVRDIILDNGIYEVTVTEDDVYNNQSGHSQPIFIQVAKSVAKVQINLRL